MNKYFAKRSQSQLPKEKALNRKYSRIIRVLFIILIIEFGIGKINGGKHLDYLKEHEQISATDNEQQKATVYEMTTLKNGATEVIFELTNDEYDYQKKEVKAQMGHTKLNAKFINDRFYVVETPSIKKPSSVKVSISAMDASGSQEFMKYQYYLQAQEGSKDHFKTIEPLEFDELIIDQEISTAQKSVQKSKKHISKTQKMIQEQQAEIKTLQEQLRETQVEEEQDSITQQITNYQQGITNLSTELNDYQIELQDNDTHLKQLQTEKDQIHAKRGKE